MTVSVWTAFPYLPELSLVIKISQDIHLFLAFPSEKIAVSCWQPPAQTQVQGSPRGRERGPETCGSSAPKRGRRVEKKKELRSLHQKGQQLHSVAEKWQPMRRERLKP